MGHSLAARPSPKGERRAARGEPARPSPKREGRAASREPAHTLSAAYGLHLLDLVARWGVRDDELLEGFGLRREDLADPDRSLPLDVAVTLYERALLLTGEPALGIYLGLQMQASAHGILGFAAMSAGTVRQTIRLTVQYMAIRTTALSFETHLTAEMGTLVLVEHADLGPAREVYLFGLLIGFWGMGCALAGRALAVSLDLEFPEPPYYERFKHALPPTRFDQPANQLVLRDLDLLDTPLLTADAASHRFARDQCDKLLLSLGLDGRVAPRVRALLGKSDGVTASLKDVAGQLNLSSRTLRRRLAEEHVTFSALIDEVRMRRALLLLRSHELTIDDIGQRLGFADVANFTRAFRRWTGTTPSAHRSGP